MSTVHAGTVACKYHFLGTKGNQGFLEKQFIPGLGHKMYIILEHFVIPESSKDYQGHVRKNSGIEYLVPRPAPALLFSFVQNVIHTQCCLKIIESFVFMWIPHAHVLKFYFLILKKECRIQTWISAAGQRWDSWSINKDNNYRELKNQLCWNPWLYNGTTKTTYKQNSLVTFGRCQGKKKSFWKVVN